MFEARQFEWKGRPYVLPASATLRTIAAVEEVLTLGQLHDFQKKGVAPVAKLSQAYGVMLRAAGATVTDEEVYEEMFEGQPKDMTGRVLQAVLTLQLLMLPPAKLRTKGEQATSPQQADSSPNATASSSVTSG